MKVLRKLVVLFLAAALAANFGCSRDPNVRKQKYLESAKRYANKGKYNEAVIQFSNALRVDSQLADAHFGLAQAYMHLKAWPGAYQELQLTVQLQPDNLPARIDLGDLLMSRRQFDKAREQAETVLARDPDNANGHALLAEIFGANKNFEAAIPEMQRAIALDPKRVGFFENLAVFQMARPGEAAGAEASLQHAIELAPQAAQARLMLGQYYMRQNRWADAEKQFREAIVAEPRNTSARTALATLFAVRKQNDKAEQVLRDASKELADSPEGRRLLADYYVATGQKDRALAEFKNLIAVHSKDMDLKKAYVQLLLDANRDQEAEIVVGELLKANQADVETAVLHGVILNRQGKPAEAVTLLEQAVRDNPDNAFARYQLGLAAAAKGDPDLARKQWAEAVRIAPGMLQAEKALAEFAIAKGDVPLLSETAENTLRANPNYPDAYIWRALVEDHRNRQDLTESDLKKTIALAPNSPLGYAALGNWSLAHKKYAEAEKLFEEALARDPKAAGAMRGLVLTYLAQKQPNQAVARVKAQMEKAPADSGYYTLLASLQFDSKDLSAAEASARKAIELDSKNLQAVVLFTRIEVSRGTMDQAIQAWQQWIKDKPNDPAGYVLLGSLEDVRQNRIQAQKWYEKALQLQPDQPIAANNLAYLMLETGQNVDVALSLAQVARRGMPQSPKSADTLAWAYYQKGTYGLARDLLQEAVKGDDANAAIHLHLGLVYEKLSDRQNAAIQLRKVLSLAPHSPQAEQARKALAELG